MRLAIFSVLFAAAICLNNQAQADLFLNLSGQAGSNVITFEATGDVTIINAQTNTFPSNNAFGPRLGGGTWDQTFDENLGDILANGKNYAFFQNELALSSGISYQKNAVEFGVLDAIDLDGEDGAGQDDIELIHLTTAIYPTLANGDVLSWSGSGTFNLDGGETFDSLFTLGSYSNAIDGGFYTVNITAIPEPGSCLVLAGLSLIALRRRRA